MGKNTEIPLIYKSVIAEIKNLLSKKEYVIISIDGRCGAGKSTLAELLAEIFPASKISMDDFFLPFEKRIPERMRECGGNIDYERFKAEVADKISVEKSFEYGIFICKTGKIEEMRTFVKKPLNIIEGSYSNHKYFGDIYDLRVFLTVDGETQRERIQIRNGEAMLKNFTEKWIPMEEHYFIGQNIVEKCDFVIDTGK